MTVALPKIDYKADSESDIEVMTIAETFIKLTKTTEHNPFEVHKIQFYFILVVTENFYSHYVDFKFYELKKGSVLFVAKNQVQHFTENFKNVKGYCIILNSQFLEQNYFMSQNHNLNRLYNYHLENPVIHEEEMGKDEFIDIVEKLYFEYTLPSNFAKADILRAYIDIILLKAERVKQQHAISGVKTKWLEIFNEFRNSLAANYIKTRSSRDYSAELLISYKLLNDIVKSTTGKTVKAFIDDFVVVEIKRYLVTTSLSVKEISYKTGFDEPANMTKFFKKNTQTTPLKFRE